MCVCVCFGFSRHKNRDSAFPRMKTVPVSSAPTLWELRFKAWHKVNVTNKHKQTNKKDVIVNHLQLMLGGGASSQKIPWKWRKRLVCRSEGEVAKQHFNTASVKLRRNVSKTSEKSDEEVKSRFCSVGKPVRVSQGSIQTVPCFI